MNGLAMSSQCDRNVHHEVIAVSGARLGGRSQWYRERREIIAW